MRVASTVVLAIMSLAAGAVAQSGTASPPAAAPQSLSDLERAISKIDREQGRLQRELDELEAEKKRVQTRIVLRGRRYVRMARAGLLPVGGGFDELVDHASQLERVRRAVSRDLEREREIGKRRVAIQKKIEDARTVRRPLQAQRVALDRARAALYAQEDRALAFQRAFETSTGSGHTAIYGSGMGPADPADTASGFASMKGRLPFPIAGRAEIRNARRGSSGPGLEMTAPRGTPVRAVFPGRVGFADEYAEYGKTIIIDHGSSHFTVSANLSDIAVRVGEEIDVGARIGSVGDDGSGPKLYFEIRVQSETVDPAEWFGI